MSSASAHLPIQNDLSGQSLKYRRSLIILLIKHEISNHFEMKTPLSRDFPISNTQHFSLKVCASLSLHYCLCLQLEKQIVIPTFEFKQKC